MKRQNEMSTAQKRALTIKANAILRDMPRDTDAQIKRYEKAVEIFSNRSKNWCGWFGRFTELVNTPDTINRKVTVGLQGQTDNYVKINRNGKINSFGCEYKINSGRVTEDLTDREFVIYEIDMNNATTNYQRRQSGKRIMRSSTFIRLLRDCNAIKKVTGKKHRDKEEYAIQGSSVKLFKAVCCYPLYDKNAVYDIDIL